MGAGVGPRLAWWGSGSEGQQILKLSIDVGEIANVPPVDGVIFRVRHVFDGLLQLSQKSQGYGVAGGVGVGNGHDQRSDGVGGPPGPLNKQ